MHKETINKILGQHKLKKEKLQLIKTLQLLDDNKIFVDDKGKDLIYEICEKGKIKLEEKMKNGNSR